MRQYLYIHTIYTIIFIALCWSDIFRRTFHSFAWFLSGCFSQSSQYIMGLLSTQRIHICTRCVYTWCLFWSLLSIQCMLTSSVKKKSIPNGGWSVISIIKIIVSTRKNGAGHEVSFYRHFDGMPVNYCLLISQVEENWRQTM